MSPPTTITLGKNVTNGEPVQINLDRLIETRACLQAGSGGGKSWTIRRLLEQSYGKVQQIVMDSEGEFHTLREKYDYLLAAAKGGDCVADVRFAKKLAHRLLEQECSAIIDICEMPPVVRVEFVKEFAEALIDAPQRLWHPAMIVIDEAHRFCPEVERGHKVARGKRTEKVSSTDAVVNLMALGRKRGFCGILATQRIAKINKDALAECQNFLIGLANIDVDQDRAAAMLGMRSKDAVELRDLEPGEFHVFGPAIARSIQKVQVGPIQTTHPKAGQRTAPLPPARAGIKRVAASFADLPAEVEEENSKIASLEAEVKKLRTQAVNITGRSPTLDREAVAEIDRRAHERGRAEGGHAVKAAQKQVERLANEIVRVAASVQRTFGDLSAAAQAAVKFPERNGNGTHAVPHPPPSPHRREMASVATTQQEARFTTPSGRAVAELNGLDGPEQKVLDAIAWLNAIGIAEPEGPAVAAIAGYKVTGGGYKNPRSRLATKGLISYPRDGAVALTEAGRALAKQPDVASLTGEAFREKILGVLDGPEKKILTPLLRAWPDRMTADAVAQDAGYGVDGGGFKNPRSRLATLGLIEYPTPGMLRARDILFPERS